MFNLLSILQIINKMSENIEQIATTKGNVLIPVNHLQSGLPG